MSVKDSRYYKNFIFNYNELVGNLTSIKTNDELINNISKANSLIDNTIHSFGDLYERISNIINNKQDVHLRKNIITESEQNIIYAFKYLNNQLKHDRELEVITACVANNSYPRFYPYVRGADPFYEWKDFKNNETNPHKYRVYYEKELIGKNVHNSIYELKNIIEKMI